MKRFLTGLLLVAVYQLQGHVELTVFANNPYATRYNGPASVARSLLNGLTRLGVEFNCNPVNSDDVSENVVVLSGFGYLERAVQLKRDGKIKRLVAGPNLAGSIGELDHIGATREIDAYIAPGLWTKAWFLEVSSLTKTVIWPAGIDEIFWQPPVKLQAKKSKQALLYIKGVPSSLIKNAEDVLVKYGWSVSKIVYGSYTIDQFRDELKKVAFAIVLGGTESQGLALAEMWAMDVPTYVYNLRKGYDGTRKIPFISHSPYLSEKTGIDWREIDELEGLVKVYSFISESFSPRNWILENMTDTVCAQKLLDIIENIKTKNLK